VVAAESPASDCDEVKSRLCFVGTEDVTGSFGVGHGRAVGDSETAAKWSGPGPWSTRSRPSVALSPAKSWFTV